MNPFASQLLLWALVSIPAYLALRHVNRPRQQQTHWTLDDLVSKRPESQDEAAWAEEYVAWRVAQVHGRGEGQR